MKAPHSAFTQVTHQPDEDGVLRQIVTPATLREVLDESGDDYARPSDFGPEDEWKTED